MGSVDLCLQSQSDSSCRPLPLRQNQPRIEITQLFASAQVSEINTLALYDPKGESIRIDQWPILAGSLTERAIFGLEIQ